MTDADGIERGPTATPADFVKALEKKELARLQVPKIDIFHFKGDRVSEWLELLEQVTAEVFEEGKFKFLPRYIWWETRPEVMKVVAGARGDWAKFKAEMQRRFKLGDGLLTKTDLEMLQRDEFSTVGAFATAFEKMAKKVPGLAEEEQCATFQGHFKNWEASSLTKKVAPGKKLTWAAIKEGVIEGEMDQVDIFQMRQARKKRKVLDASTSEGRNFKRMVEDVVAQLDAEKKAKRKTMAAPQTQGKTKKAVVQEEEKEEEEEPEPQKLTKAQRKAKIWPKADKAQEEDRPRKQQHCLPRSRMTRPRRHPMGLGRVMELQVLGLGTKGHTIKFCHIRRNDKDEGLISTNYDGDMYDKFGYYIDPEIPGGSRKEALRRVEAGEPPAPPAMFRILQEEEVRPDVRVEEIGENEEVEQERKAGTVKEEPIVIESDGEIERGYWNEARRTMEKMEDLVAKIGRYQDKLTNMCEKVKGWKGKKPLVYLYDMGPGPQGGSGSLPGVTISGPTPWSGMAYRPPSRSGEAPQAVRTRAKRTVSPNEPAKDILEPSGEKETVDILEDEDERDERLRTEEDKRAELREKKRDVKADTDRAPEGKKRKYVVRVEEGYDVEEIMDRILEGHNHLMNLKDVLASALRLRDELKARLSRKMVASVRLGAIIPKEAEWAETGTKMDWKSVACGCLDVVVRGKTCTAMVDTGAEMNLIKEEHALRLGMEIDHSDNGVLMGANSRPMTAMHTRRGMIHMNVAPQGWTNAVAMVERHMVRAMQSVSPHITQPYIDDLVVKGPKEKDEQEVMPGIRRFVWDHVQDLCKVLDLLKEHNLTASGTKSRYCMRGATILGFVCDEKGRRPDTKKTNKILEWTTPFETITEVRSFLGTCGFWKVFIKGFVAKTEQLRKLVRQGQDWEWGDKQESVIEGLKKEFEEGGLVLGVPDHAVVMTRPFIVETDAGPTALGEVLIQRDLNGKERPLRFECRTLNTTERNYSQFKRETLAVRHCLRIFRNYLFDSRFRLRVDPTALASSLKNFAPSDPTIVRWLTYIWMFDFELERIPGNKNRADGLSRIDWDKRNKGVIEDTPPVDGFLDKEEDVKLHINSWSLVIGNYVTLGRPIWLAPPCHVRRSDIVLKPYIEEDSWGMSGVEWMMELALADKYQLREAFVTLETGPQQKEEQTAERTQRGGPSGGSDIPPHPAQVPEATHKPGMQPETSHRAQGQGKDEDQAAREKEQDKEERAAIAREIRVQIRLKNMAELHEKVEQGEQPVILEDRKENGSPTQDDETPLFTEAWDNFDKLLEAAGRPREQHQEMGVKLVSTDLLSLKGLMKEGFAVAKTSDEKMEKRLTRVAWASHEKRIDWQKEIGDLKKELERQDKEMEALKIEVEKAWAGNEAITQVNQTLNKVNDTLRTYLQVQLVDWTEVQEFEIRKQPAEEAFKSQKVEERANEQRGEEIPLLDEKMFEPQETLAGKDLKAGEFEWRMPTILAHEQGLVRPGVRSPTEANMDEAAPPTIQRETVGQQEAQESMGQARVEAEVEENLEVSQKTPPPQDMPLVAGLEEALGSWATGSGAEERVSEQVAQTEERAACPTPSETPQQEVTSEVTAVPSSVLSQEEEKTTQKKPGKYFYCKKGKHFSDDCPKFYEDEARGFVTGVSTGIWRDRNGNLVERSCDGGRMQLYRQIGEVVIDQDLTLRSGKV
ncbi:hypothetical protein CBR_g34216 [Chara braunii]|uniref:RNA-directed DNA polymerase n=1 Tax=Chara braunii TaxID=69332 RepID=A0A388LIH0_CHABU|nr:hypothetical protein CBR_g34216 [Chara braunii]|eukprot:GBG82035.1 hypothetical protein CBR_g34216 [Chara braunii]